MKCVNVLTIYCVPLNLMNTILRCMQNCGCCANVLQLVSQVEGLRNFLIDRNHDLLLLFLCSYGTKWHIYAKINNAKQLSRDVAVLTNVLRTDRWCLCGQGNSLEVLEALACLPALHFPAKHRAEEFLNMPARVRGVYREPSSANAMNKMTPHL